MLLQNLCTGLYKYSSKNHEKKWQRIIRRLINEYLVYIFTGTCKFSIRKHLLKKRAPRKNITSQFLFSNHVTQCFIGKGM